MKIRGLLKKAAVAGSVIAVPGLAMAGTVESETTNVATSSQVATVTINVAATVGGFLNLQVRPRNTGTDLIAPVTTGTPAANPQTGDIDFGIVDAAGNHTGTGRSESPTTSDAFYIAELTAEVFYTGISDVDLSIAGNPFASTGPTAKWGCVDATTGSAGTAAWGSASAGQTLSAAGASCFNFSGGAGDASQTVAVDLAFLISDTTATGSYNTDYVFTATPTVL